MTVYVYGSMNSLPPPGELEYLINSTVLSLAATARTDSDRNVVGTALETMESLFKSLKVSCGVKSCTHMACHHSSDLTGYRVQDDPADL